MLFNRNTEHLTGRGTVDIFSFREYFRTSGLTGKIGQHSGFNGGEVADNELVSGTGHEGPSGSAVTVWSGDIIIEQLQGIVIAGFHNGSGLCEIWHVVLRKGSATGSACLPTCRSGWLRRTETCRGLCHLCRQRSAWPRYFFTEGFCQLQAEPEGFFHLAVRYHRSALLHPSFRGILLSHRSQRARPSSEPHCSDSLRPVISCMVSERAAFERSSKVMAFSTTSISRAMPLSLIS